MELQVIDDVSNRLDKLESKIDRLADAVITIARIEERVTTVLKQNDRFIMRLDRLEDRVETVEQTAKLNKKDVSNGERVFWVVFSAVIAARLLASLTSTTDFGKGLCNFLIRPGVMGVARIGRLL